MLKSGISDCRLSGTYFTKRRQSLIQRAKKFNNSLHQFGLEELHSDIGVPLTRGHRRLRREWSQVHQGGQLRNVLFSDKKRFSLGFAY